VPYPRDFQGCRLTDITHWKIPRFSPKADGLISEIIPLGGTAELQRTIDLFAPPPISEFEASLQAIRDHLYCRIEAAI
jgi:hypothetical protein